MEPLASKGGRRRRMVLHPNRLGEPVGPPHAPVDRFLCLRDPILSVAPDEARGVEEGPRESRMTPGGTALAGTSGSSERSSQGGRAIR